MRSPLSQLHSNALEPPEARSGTKAAGGGSRLQGARQPGGSAVRHQHGLPPQPASRGSTVVEAAGAAPLMLAQPPATVFSHSNPAFDARGHAEWDPLEAGQCGAASPALTQHTDQQDITPGMLDQAVYTPATARSIQAWLLSGTPGRGGMATAGTQRGATPAIPTPEAWQILERMQQPSPGEQAGVFNIVNAYLRTGAQMLSPEPGYEGGAAIRAPTYMAAVVSKPAPAAPRPLAALPHEAPGSVCSQSSEGSCGAGSATSLARPMQSEEGDGAEEGQCVMLVKPVHAHDEVPSLGTTGAAAGQRSSPPSPISFSLPADSPGTFAAQGTKTESPTFSFGVRANGAAQEQQAAAEEDAAAGAPAMDRIDSNSSVEQPNPFKAMLCHLRGPQYASPAPAALPRPPSPKSPSECTPVLLLPTEVVAAQHAAPSAATPELGKGSLTQWINRRGLHQALNTPARLDLQVLWAAMRDNRHVRSETDAVRAENAALQRELERLQSALRELGVEYHAAVEAAEANQVYAEAEIAKAKEAAQQMMQLSNQIQQMFNLCEAEKAELLAKLLTAQQRLADVESGDSQSNSLEQAELEKQIEGARAAVAAAQRAADLAESRANEACSELLSIRAELEAAQAQLAASAQAAPQATPVGALRSRLQGMQDALEGLQSRQASLASPGLDSKRKVELQQMLAQSKQQLGTMQAMLGGEDDLARLISENQSLRQQVQEMSAALAAHTPASVKQQERDLEMRVLFGSPTPLRLSAEFTVVSNASPEVYASEHSPSLAGSYSLAPSSTEASPALSDFFSSPYLASQATLTVDYRDLHGAVLADTAASRARTPSITPEHSDDELVEYGSPTVELQQCLNEQAHQAYTVQCNRLIVTNVPESELSKVKSMVQYWEAVATGTVPPGEVVQDPADAALAAVAEEASPAVGTALPETSLQQQLPAAPEDEAACQEEAAVVVAEEAGAVNAAEFVADEGPSCLPAAAADPAPEAAPAVAVPAAEARPDLPAASEGMPLWELSPHRVARELQSHPLETPFTAIAASFTPTVATAAVASPAELPEGPAATPAAASAGEEALASTPARFTPLNFAADVPPAPHNTPAPGSHATPAAAAGPLPTPNGINITPLSLSALRRAGSSDMQAAVRNRLQRLKQDLQKAQAKLHNVDQGLAAFAVSPTSSAVHSLASTPSCATPTTAQKATPFSGSAASSPVGSCAAVPAASTRVAIAQPAAAGEGPATGAAMAAEAEEAAPAAEPAAGLEIALSPARQSTAENQDVNEAGAATPITTKPSVRFAEEAAAGDYCQSSKPMAARASPLGYASPSGACSAVRRASPGGTAAHCMAPGVRRSAVKTSPSPLRHAALDSDSDSSASGSSSDDEDLFDHSRMAILTEAATPKAAKTPMARPEAPAGTPQSMAFSSTSSFSPPEPLALMSIKPMNRMRRAPAGLAAGRRRPSETEEREFRRRAAALNIQISPYFRSRR